MRWVGVGRRGHNVGITNLSVRKSYAGSFDYQAYVSLVNHTAESQTFAFTLELDGKPLAEKSVTMEPSVRRSVVLPFSHTGGGAVAARLQISDDLAADNVGVGGAAAAPEDRGHSWSAPATCSWRRCSRPIPRWRSR